MREKRKLLALIFVVGVLISGIGAYGVFFT